MGIQNDRGRKRAHRPIVLTILIAFVASALGGCIGAGNDPTTQTDDVPPELVSRLPVGLPQDRRGTEPSIAIMDDGTIFVTGQVGAETKKADPTEGASWLWRSQDDGATWEILRSPYNENAEEDPYPHMPSSRCSCDADVVVSPDQWVYYTDWAFLPSQGYFIVERSSDGGDTWASSILPTQGDFPTSDRQWLLAGDDGFVALFYHKWDAVAMGVEQRGARVDAIFSHDHGATWGDPVTVIGDTGAFYHGQAHPRILPDGTLMLAYMDLHPPGDDRPFSEFPASVHVTLSEDQGASWHSVDIAEAPEGWGAGLGISADVDPEGRVLAAYTARTGDDITLFTVESPDGGRTWRDPEALRTVGSNVLPWVAANDDGAFAIAWYALERSGPPSDAPEDAPWHVHVAERTEPDGPWAVRLADPEPVVTGPYCFDGDQPGQECPGRPLGDFLNVAYGPDGDLHLVYAKETERAGIMIGPLEYSSRTAGMVYYVQAEKPEAGE